MKTFGDICRELCAEGYRNLWSLELWRSGCNGGKEPPISMTPDFIASNEGRGKEFGDWGLDDNTVIFVRRTDGVRFRVYCAA